LSQRYILPTSSLEPAATNYAGEMYEDLIREEFTHQSRSFGTSPAMTSAATLGALIELVPEDVEADWIDIACGPGVVSRATAGRVGSVKGVDLTPAMIEEAERRAVGRESKTPASRSPSGRGLACR